MGTEVGHLHTKAVSWAKCYRLEAAVTLVGKPAMEGLNAVQAGCLLTINVRCLSNRLHSACKVLCITLRKDPQLQQTWQGARKWGGDRGEEIRRIEEEGWEGGGAGMAKVG